MKKEKKKMNRKYIFVVGGVMSSVGKGIAAASIGKILQSHGYDVTNIKCEMYVNIDAGTIRPTEHGEVFVCNDGIETDQDLGNYERFTKNMRSRDHFLTYGQIYQEIIRRERNLEYDGEDVEVVPDVPNEMIRRFNKAITDDKAEIAIIELGGTIGEYQLLLYLEAARMLKLKHPEDVCIAMVSYLPVPHTVGEMKTKPTQYASRTLNEAGLQADFILARGPHELDKKRKEKLAIFCNIHPDDVISAPDVSNLYEIPLGFEKENLGKKMLTKLKLKSRTRNGLNDWQKFVTKIEKIDKEVNIAVVGKYFATGSYVLSDSYISVIEAIKHAGYANDVKVKLTWINSEDYENNPAKLKELKSFAGVVVPGGFGKRGTEGIIKAIQFVRENKIPYFGLCYGMQLATIEFARNVAGIKKATSSEIEPDSEYAVINTMSDQKGKLAEKNYGASMRLGAYKALLKKNTIVAKAYKTLEISERHRHRYEVNSSFVEQLEKAGLVFSGTSPDGKLMEIIELPKAKHPFFVGTQFHPEFQSYPIESHPLFKEFIKVCLGK